MNLRGCMGVVSALALVCTTPQSAFAEPLKVALVEALSGTAAAGGKVYQDATGIAIDKLNAGGGFNGEPIQLLVIDNGGNTTQASDKVKEAIDNGAHIIVQAGASSISGQISEDVRKHNIRNPQKPVMYLNLGGEALELTGPKCNFYTFRLAPTASMRIGALLDVLQKNNQLGTRVFSVNQNYSYGQDAEAAIVAGASKYGYQVVGKVLHDFGRVQDFAPYAAKIKEADADTIITGDWANDLVLLIKATRESGLKAVFGTTYLDYPGVMAGLGDLALGNYVAMSFNPEFEKPEVVEAFKAKTGRYPAFGGDLHFVRMFDLLGSALAKLSVKGGSVETKKIALGLEGASMSDTMGTVTVRKEDHQAILPLSVSVAKAGVKYPSSGAQHGLVSVGIVTGEQAIYPVQSSCKMERPE